MLWKSSGAQHTIGFWCLASLTITVTGRHEETWSFTDRTSWTTRRDVKNIWNLCQSRFSSEAVCSSSQVEDWSANGGQLHQNSIRTPSQLHQDLPWTMLQCSRELIGHRAELHHHAASAPLTRRSRWRFNPEVNSVTSDSVSAETTMILHCFQIKGAVSVFLLQQCESCRELLTSHYTFTALTQLCLSLYIKISIYLFIYCLYSNNTALHTHLSVHSGFCIR